MEHENRQKIRAFWMFALTFVLGAFLGFFAKTPIQSLIYPGETVAIEYRDGDPDGSRPSGEVDRNRYRQLRPGPGRMQGDAGRNGERFRMYLIRELDLSEEQIEPFFRETRENRRAMREIMDHSRRDLNRRMQAQADTLHAGLRVVLTEEQLQRWMEIRRQYEQQQNRSGM